MKRLAELPTEFGPTIDTADVGRTRLVCAPLPFYSDSLPGTLAPPTPRQIEQKYDWIRETNSEGVTEVIVTYSYAEMFGLAEARIAFDADEHFRLVDDRIVSVLDLYRGMNIVMADGTIGTISGNPERRYEIPVPPLKSDTEEGLWTSRVVGRVKHTAHEIYEFGWAGETVKVTAGHEVWSKDRRGWVGAHELFEGENIRVCGNDFAPAESIRRIPGMIEVFGIEVEYFHNYFVGSGPNAMLVHNGPQCVVHPAVVNRSSFSVRGARRIDGLREATHADVVKAFHGSGFKPSSHFISRVIDPRTQAAGTRTFADLQTIIRRGQMVDAHSGAKAFVHNGMAVVVNPKTGVLITLTPW